MTPRFSIFSWLFSDFNGKVLVSHSGITGPPRIHDDIWRVGQETFGALVKAVSQVFFTCHHEKILTFVLKSLIREILLNLGSVSPRLWGPQKEHRRTRRVRNAQVWNAPCTSLKRKVRLEPFGDGWSHLDDFTTGQWPFQGPKLEVPRCTYGPYHIQGLNFRAKLSGKIYGKGSWSSHWRSNWDLTIKSDEFDGLTPSKSFCDFVGVSPPKNRWDVDVQESWT